MHIDQIYDNQEKNDGIASKMLKSLKDSLGINEKVNHSFINGELILSANKTKIILKRESNNNTKINIKIYNGDKEVNLDSYKIPPLYWISNKTFELWLNVVLGKFNKSEDFNLTDELFEDFNKLDKVYQDYENHEFSEEELNEQLERFNNNLKLEDFPEGTIGADLTEAWVERYESQNYSGVLNSFLEMTSNGDLYTIMQECDKNNVPYEMAFLAISESNWNPYAMSGVGAFGYWQIMDRTAISLTDGKNVITDLVSKSGIVKGDFLEDKEKKLKNYFSNHPNKKDFRMDPKKSTKLAIEYLKERHRSISINKKNINLSNSDSWYWTMHDYNGGWTMLSKLPDFLDKTNGNSSLYGKYGSNFENIKYVPVILAIKKVIKKVLESKKTIQGIKDEINNNGKGKESNEKSINIFWLSKKLEYNGFKNNLNNFKVSSQNNVNKDYFNLELKKNSTGNNDKIYLSYNGSEKNILKIKRNLIELLKIKKNQIDEKSIIIKNNEITIDLKDFEKFWNTKKINNNGELDSAEEIIEKYKNNRNDIIGYLKTIIRNGLKEELESAKKSDLILYKDLSMIRNGISSGKLVKLENENYELDKSQIGEYYKNSSDKELNYYTLKKSKEVLDEIGEKFNQSTGKKFTITSGIRSVDYQKDLKKSNGNGAKGISSHNYGIAFDITHVSMNNEETIKMALILKEMEKEGKIFALIEAKQQCFHIAVNPSYKK